MIRSVARQLWTKALMASSPEKSAQHLEEALSQAKLEGRIEGLREACEIAGNEHTLWIEDDRVDEAEGATSVYNAITARLSSLQSTPSEDKP